MKVDTEIASNKRVLKKLNNDLKSKIASREKELKYTDRLFDDKKQLLRIQHAKETHDLKSNHNKNILEAAEFKEQKLNEYKANLNRERNRLEKEKLNLATANKKQMDSMLQEHNMNFRERFETAETQARDINDRTQKALLKSDEDSRTEIQESNRLASLASSSVKQRNQDAIDREKEDYMIKLNRSKTEHATNLAKEKLRFEEEKRRLYELQAGQTTDREEIHKKKMAEREEFYNKQLMANEKRFKNKIQQLFNAQGVVLKNFENRFLEEINKIEREMSQKKQLIQEKGRDDFYHIKSINPRVMDLGDKYFLKLKLPKHEKGRRLNQCSRQNDSFNLSKTV